MAERRRVLLRPLWKLHVGYHLHELANYPPSGYEFVSPPSAGTSIMSLVSKWPRAPLAYSELSRLLPLSLMKSWVSSRRDPRNGVDLAYCCHHVSFGRLPWVVELDAVWDPIGPHFGWFRRLRGVVEKRLASNECRGILAFSEFSAAVLRAVFPDSAVSDKITVLPRAVVAKSVARVRRHEGFRLLFVGSANLVGEFEMRGGKEVLEAFEGLARSYPHLWLTVRSDIPKSVARAYADLLAHPRLEWVQGWVAREKLEEMYSSADVLLLPGHYDNWLVVLEAMSYGLPVITTDIYANRERVRDGDNGFLVRPAGHVPYFQNDLPLFIFTREFRRALARTDPGMVRDLMDKIMILVENRELARRMGDSARETVQRGPFSIENRNGVLERVFNHALL